MWQDILLAGCASVKILFRFHAKKVLYTYISLFMFLRIRISTQVFLFKTKLFAKDTYSTPKFYCVFFSLCKVFFARFISSISPCQKTLRWERRSSITRIFSEILKPVQVKLYLNQYLKLYPSYLHTFCFVNVQTFFTLNILNFMFIDMGPYRRGKVQKATAPTMKRFRFFCDLPSQRLLTCYIFQNLL